MCFNDKNIISKNKAVLSSILITRTNIAQFAALLAICDDLLICGKLENGFYFCGLGGALIVGGVISFLKFG